MVTAFFMNLFRRGKNHENNKNSDTFTKNSKPINLIFSVVVLLNIMFIAIPVIVKVPVARQFANWYLKDTGSMQGDFITSIATILGTLLAVTGAVWAQSFFDAQKEKKLIKVILSQLYTELEDICDRARECFELMYEIAKRNNIPSDKAEDIPFRISEYEDLQDLAQFVISAWDRYKSDIILLFNNEQFLDQITYLYSIIGMVGNYPRVTIKNFAAIHEKSLKLCGEVEQYLNQMKK